MPFIKSIRSNAHHKNIDKKPSITDYLDITGGDTVLTQGGYRVHMFTTVGDASLDIRWKDPKMAESMGFLENTLGVEYLVVAGGGNGNSDVAGGGGAGGYLSGGSSLTPGSKSVSVGGNRGNSVFDSITSIGGGVGGNWTGGGGSGGSSGGGGGSPNGTPNNPGNATTDQGNAGYRGCPTATDWGGGGGGAGRAGGPDGGHTSWGGDGGQGLTNAITGTNTTYAGGGGGGGSGRFGIGGSGGGGNGDLRGPAVNVQAGTANRGGGGGSHGCCAGGRNGGSGIVVVRYLL